MRKGIEFMHERLQIRAALALSLVILLLAGCSSGPRIVTNSDPSADWTQYRTFGFFQPLGTDRYSVRSITSDQLIAAAKVEMEKAGFTYTEVDPDLLLNFVISTRDTVRSRPASGATVHHGRGRYGTWSGWSVGMSTTELVQETEGTLGMDIVDRARSQLVWEGAATKRITNSVRNNQEQVINEVIAEIFTRFP
jgi:hypothetical protein